MRRHPRMLTKAAMGVALAAAPLALAGSTASAAPLTINLCAVTGTATLTGSVTVPIWGFGIPATPGNCATATASLPGPLLSINQDDDVTINVTNALPAGHTLRFEVPGIAFNAGPVDAAAGATVTRTFSASAPGTYGYQSGGDAGRQTAMGLYGMLIVRSSTPGQAYGTLATAYDVEAPLVLSAVDPAFNAAPDSYDMYAYTATYWLINGKAYPATAGITATSGQRVLLRYLNAGFDNSSMALLGMHGQVVARDARLLNDPFFANTETLPAGGTEDEIAVLPATAPPSSHGFPLYNRQLHLANGGQNTAPANQPVPAGGQLTFIHS